MTAMLRQLFARAATSARESRLPGRRPFRPTLECLESRIVPNAYQVTNLNDTGPGSLRTAITAGNANPGSTIDFAAGLTGTINLNSTLSISAAMEIDGPGAGVITVSGRNLSQVLTVEAPGAVTINGLTIANGRGPFGGGIENLFTPLSLSRVTFTNNQSTNGGGLYSFSATASVSNCVFTGNRVVAPSGYTNTVYGGALTSVSGYLTVANTQFINNSAVGASNVPSSASFVTGNAQGGAVDCFGDFGTDIFTNCTFNSNSARGGSNDTGASGTVRIGVGEGGAIDVNSCSVEVDNSTFATNVAQGGTTTINGSSGFDCGGGYGGAMHVNGGGQLTANDDTLTLNRALGANGGNVTGVDTENHGAGGAINAEDTGTSLFVTGDQFASNTAMGGVTGATTTAGGHYGGNGKGGAIYVRDASAQVSGCTFTSNVAIGASGTFDAAGGTGFGGAIRSLRGQITIGDFTQFNNNRAQGGNGGPSGGSGGNAEGGGVSAESSDVTLWDLTFSSNRAIGGNGQGTSAIAGFAAGGGISLFLTTTTADNLAVQSNLAQGGLGVNGANGGYGYGGGIYASSDTAVAISDSQVTLNTAQGGLSSGGFNGSGYGGGICDFENPGVFALINTAVFNNHASTAGDDIYP